MVESATNSLTFPSNRINWKIGRNTPIPNISATVDISDSDVMIAIELNENPSLYALTYHFDLLKKKFIYIK